MKLKLTRPLVFFDLETTGLDLAKDRIIELSYYKFYPNGSSESKTYRINPEQHISAESTQIHGITDDDVRDCPTFKQVAPEIVKAWEGCDMAGYNSNHFDIPMMAEELLRADVDFDLKKRNCIDAFVIFQKNEPRNLTAAYRFYCDKDLTAAQSADADTKATAEVLFAQLERYENLPDTVEDLAAYTTKNNAVDFAGRIIYDAQGREIFSFGKYRGEAVKDVLLKDPGYYSWMMQGAFPEYTKKVLTRIYIETKKKH